MRIGGWKTKSMFARYNVVDERDLTEGAERLAGFLADAASAPPTIVPLARSTPPGGGPSRRTRTEHGQSTPVGRCSGQLDGHKLPNSIRGEGRGPVASPVFKSGRRRPAAARRVPKGSISLLRSGGGPRPSPPVPSSGDKLVCNLVCKSQRGACSRDAADAVGADGTPRIPPPIGTPGGDGPRAKSRSRISGWSFTVTLLRC
jgi:hypothetical protein